MELRSCAAALVAADDSLVRGWEPCLAGTGAGIEEVEEEVEVVLGCCASDPMPRELQE